MNVEDEAVVLDEDCMVDESGAFPFDNKARKNALDIQGGFGSSRYGVLRVEETVVIEDRGEEVPVPPPHVTQSDYMVKGKAATC
ncbi:hypothetical protein V6N12_001524 [Hibiscus sabdariffa]|uniref:Uncharacterized protein n=1 Tax=Hibiscus sabdariffa TaxID=183260 RepID=A0ABR2BQU4_9ROSI